MVVGVVINNFSLNFHLSNFKLLRLATKFLVSTISVWAWKQWLDATFSLDFSFLADGGFKTAETGVKFRASNTDTLL